MEHNRYLKQCPHCSMPLARDEAAGTACPVCREPFYETVDDQTEAPDLQDESQPVEQTEIEDDPQDVADDEPKRTLGLVIAIVAVVLVMLAGIVLTGVFSPRSKEPAGASIDRKPVVTTRPDLPPDTQPTDLAAASPANPLVKDKPAEPAEDIPEPPEQELPVLVDEDPPMRDDEQQDLPEWGDEVKLSDPKGLYAVESVNSADRYVISGKIKTLQIGDINGQGAVVTKDLDAREIVVAGAINGEGVLRLDVPDASVTFLRSFNGASRIRVYAPGGKVVLGSDDKSLRDSGNVLGSSNVTIVARDVDLRGVLDGGSRVKVTLTKGGSLRFSKIAGGAHLYYRKAESGDPELKIDRGGIIGGGKFERLDPLKAPGGNRGQPLNPSPPGHRRTVTRNQISYQ